MKNVPMGMSMYTYMCIYTCFCYKCAHKDMFLCPNDIVTYILIDKVSISGNKHCNCKVLPLNTY